MIEILEILEFIKKNTFSSFFYTPLKEGNECSYFFKSPVKTIECHDIDSIDKTLNEIDKLKNQYPYAYGYIAYEVGYSFEERLKNLIRHDHEDSLIRFNFYDESSVKIFKTKNIDFSQAKEILISNKQQIENYYLNIKYNDYKNNIEKIKDLIAKGDTYQVNYTLKSHFDFKEDIIDLFLQLLFNQSASYTALINDDNNFVISISPELFFSTREKTITSKPMKGTIKRGLNIEDDNIQKRSLLSSAKDRSENIMIVDLLRNDLGKISEFGSVIADPIFEIEKYETVFQMTSTVKAQLLDNSFKSIIKNIFPCGSITGAPKIRTMGIIKELESEERGIYTGTIGIINNHECTFNIPIRTVTINKKKKEGTLGIGGGIVWDSDPILEYKEAELKGRFLSQPVKYFELIETILIDKGELFLFDYHLNRLKASAEYFLFYLDIEKVRKEIIQYVDMLNNDKNYRLRILLSKWGELTFTVDELSTPKSSNKVIISNKKIDSKNTFQFFKTTNRKVYDDEYLSYNKDFFDVLFLNENDSIAEGAISNIIIRKDGHYYTPPLQEGILNGCYREHLLQTQRNIEVMSFGIKELIDADELILINSVRKEINISELCSNDGEVIKKYF